MRIWKYTLEEGKELRQLIDDRNSVEIIILLRNLCDKLVEKGYEDFEELYYLLENEEEIIINDELEEYSWENEEELVDDRLSQFYDLCDENDIFVALR